MTRDRKGPTGREAVEEIEARLGTLFGSLGEALNTVIDMAGDASASGKGGAERSFDLSNGPVRAQSSIRVRVGGMDTGKTDQDRDLTTPVNAAASGSRPAGTQPEEPGSREPVVDTYIDEGFWVLTAEMPGIPEDAVMIAVEGRELKISAKGAFSYETTLAIPDGLDPETLSHAITNGILELRGRVETGATGT